MTQPDKTEYDPYYAGYVSLVTESEIMPVLAAQPGELRALFSNVPEDRGSFAYETGKWTIKQLLGHLNDAERIFAYRALRISRADETPIEGFEQHGYIENAHSNDRTISDLIGEFDHLRQANLLMFGNVRGDGWLRFGTANQTRISVRALAFIMAGHIRHHARILQERYLD
jgi:hypothetical protein